MSLETFLEHQIDLEKESIKEHNLILFNDDVNTFEHVIDMLIKVCKHEPEQAEQCAFIVHYKGKCQVKKGTYNDLQPKAEILAEVGLTVEIY